MAIVSAAALKQYFEENDAPTSANFSDLIDSLFARGSAAGTAQGVAGLGAGTVGDDVFFANTTASAKSVIGAGAVGTIQFEQATTASAQTVIGGGAVGRAVFEQSTTASAQTVMGGLAVGRNVFQANTTASAVNQLPPNQYAATTAQVAAGTDASSRFITPDTIRFSTYVNRAYASFTSAGAIQVSERVSSVTKSANGRWTITFAPALPTANYGMWGITHDIANLICTTSARSVSAAQVRVITGGGVLVDPTLGATFGVVCSGI